MGETRERDRKRLGRERDQGERLGRETERGGEWEREIMEVSLQLTRPVWCSNVCSDTPNLKLKPRLGFTRTTPHLSQVMLFLQFLHYCFVIVSQLGFIY